MRPDYGEKMAMLVTNCFRCKKRTPHKSLGTARNAKGEKHQRMECMECHAVNDVVTGEEGEKFQENVDAPDYTDLSALEDEKPVISVVAKIPPVKAEQRDRVRVKVCTDGTAGPYVLCNPGDLTKLRIILKKWGIGISFDAAVITDGSPQGKSWAGMANLNDIPEGTNLEHLQEELDAAFPYDVEH